MSKLEVIQILDVLMDDPEDVPDLNVVSQIAAGSKSPIALMCSVVELMWKMAERPEEFDEAVAKLYE